MLFRSLQPQDAMSRHRGAKPSRRYGLLGKISLLSPGYLLSVERPRFHTQWPGHYALLSHLLDLSVSQSSSLVSLHSTADCQPAMLLAEQLAHESCVRPGPLVLGTALLKSPAPTEDRDRTVSRRSKPSSRTALMGEQPNPWDLLRPQDATSRHRGRSEEHTSELQSP